MKYRIFTILLVLVVVVLCGCQTPQRRFSADADCPGKATVAEAVRLLALQRHNVQPLEVAADCTISWREADGTEKNENIDGPLYFVPPGKIRFAGNKFGKVQFGTNETEFWLLVEPDISSYWWGDKARANDCRETMLINPANIAEALGIVDVTADWTLRHRGNYDILDLTKDGKRVKRVYVNTCDYHIKLIEYFDADQMKQVAIELSDYTRGDNGIVVPSRIRMGYFNRQGLEESSAQMNLKQVRVMSPKKQGKKLFVRPSSDRYKEVYQLSENCEFELVK